MLSFPTSIKRELAKLFHYLPWAFAALIFSLIPAVNIAAPLVWFALGAWMMAIQYGDFPMGNHEYSFKQMKHDLSYKRMSSFGFGATVMLGTMAPIINFVVMPIAVCGATAYWVDIKKAQEISKEVGI